MDAEKQSSRRKERLSDDLETEIIARLPVKSLFRFKCVCKSWYTLFASPDFISTHTKTYKGKKVSFFCHRSATRNHSNSRSSILSFRFGDTLSHISCPLPYSHFNILKIIGCSYGVVCLLIYDVFALWNPATKQFRTIGGLCIPEDNVFCEDYGFCIDPIADSFKLVCVMFPNNHNNNAEEEHSTNFKVKLFTPSTNSWRQESIIIPYGFSLAGNGIIFVTCVRNNMYWEVTGTPFEKYILCFDMVNEMFERIELPPSCGSRFTRLACYKDTIALFVHKELGFYSPCGYFAMWVMNDSLRTSKTWSHEMIIAPTRDLKSAQGSYIKDDIEMPVVTGINGQHVLFDPNRLVTRRFPWVGESIEIFQYNDSLLWF